ncbi:FecR family protein [Luteimonas suaedae]|uniref:FecR family protein n=1 Tax=Luteimonas suaedae TaxID=2605430 RepID=UPI0011EE067B|nr:FecR domain-containing protein [Luteimonas suaedae]
MESREQHEQAAAAWLLRQDAGPWTEQDAAAFEAWLAQSAGHRAAYYRFKGAWQEAGRLRALLGRGTAPPAAAARRRPWRRLPGLAIAASVACAVGLAALAYLLVLSPSNVYATRVGALETVSLPDGSRLTLNTDSRLHIDMDANDRRVRLRQGEAFFEVAKDPLRPFVVEAGDKRIIAVGTAFSVRRSGSDVRVVVSEGRVRVEAVGRPAEVLQAPLLDAGMIASTRGDAVLVQTRSPVEIAQSLSWRTGQLVFRDTPMAEVVAEFNRYNTRKLVIEDAAVDELRVGGIFHATQLDAFVSLVQRGFPVQARAEDDRIVLTARK